MAKNGVDGVYDSDPRANPAARRFERLTHDQVVAMHAKVMDAAAFVLAAEQKLTMHVFDIATPDALRRICLGEDVGTLITSAAPA